MAFHEAGHAVAALHLQIRFDAITLSRVSVHHSQFDLTDPYDIERDAIFTLAGEVAEGLMHNEIGHTSEDDRKLFEQLCIDRHPNSQELRDRWRKEIEEKTNALVERHCESIERLSEFLLENRRVSEREAREHLNWKASSNGMLMVWDGDL
jgi:hypothetical protein